MHGLQHYTDVNKQKLKEQQERDAIKENLAKQNNFKLIVVECKRTDWNYMINNIKKTELAKIFDLDNVDWVEIKKRCMTKLTK